jgi:membrane protease YdiL (CAAX protease family)
VDVPDRPALLATKRALGLAAIGFALALIVYNNVAYSIYDIAFPPAWVLYPRAIIMPALAIAGAVWICGLTLRDVGLARGSFARGATIGLALAAAAALPIALVLVGISFLEVDAFSFRNIERASGRPGHALYWAFVLYPLHTVIFEELLFRGVLQGLGTRAFGLTRGIVLTAGTFALWHVAVDHRVLGRAEIADYPVLFVLLQACVLMALFAGGVVLSLLRERTGSVLTPMAFHWGFLVLLAGTLFAIAM